MTLSPTVHAVEQQKKQQRDDVRRIEPANSSFPEGAEANVRFGSGCFGPGPLQVNAESGDDEEQKDADVTKRTRELDQPNRVLEEIVRKNVFALLDGVIENYAQSCNASKRIDAAQASASRGESLGESTFWLWMTSQEWRLPPDSLSQRGQSAIVTCAIPENAETIT